MTRSILIRFTRVLETLHLALIAHALYFYLVTNHANYPIQDQPVWYSVFLELLFIV